MESDLPLIEISDEDDSLLQHSAAVNDVASNLNNDYFSLSPLQLPISKPSIDSVRASFAKDLKDSVDPERPSCSSPRGSNKENMSGNRSEGQKLSLEPLQMKRRKRGGFNLRKSLAWDRAFFTEEGVLDPLELSMITGAFGNTCGETLSAINEEGRNSLSGDSNVDTRAFEETVHIELPGSSSSEQRKKGGFSLPPRDSPVRVKLTPTSVVMQEIPSANVHTRNGLRGIGCLRPLASSSLKRPADVHTSKAANRDFKLPKIPGPKPGPRSLPTSTKSGILRASNLKHNQITRPTVNIEKNLVESSSKNVKSAQNKAKSGPNSLPAKISAQHSRGNSANSPLEVYSLTNTQPLLIKKASSRSQLTPTLIVPSTTVISSEGQHGPSVIGGSLPQDTHYTGGNTCQLQKGKPSGLRKPSPSLRFFGQRSTQPGNIPESSTLGLRKFAGDSGPPLEPRTISKMNEDITENSRTGGLTSSMQCSGLSNSNVVVHKTMKSDLVENNEQKREVQVPFGKSSEPKSFKHKVHDVIDTDRNIEVHVQHNKMDEISYHVDANLQLSYDQQLLESGTCKQLREDNNGRMVATSKTESSTDLESSQCMPKNICEMHDMNVGGKEGMIEHHHGKQELENYLVKNHGVTSELQSSMEELDHPSTEPMKNFSGEDNQVSYGGSNSRGASKLLGECFYDITEEMEVVDLKAPSINGTECKSADFPFHHEQSEQETEAATGVGKLCNRSDVVDAQLWTHNKILYVVNSNNNQSTSPGEHLDLRSTCLLVEKNSQFTLDLCSEEYQVKEDNETVQCVIPERNEISKSESNGVDVPSIQLPDKMRDGEFDINEMAEQPPLEAQFGFVEIIPSVESEGCSIDTCIRHDVRLIDHATSSEVDTSCQSQESGSVVKSVQASLNEINVQTIGVHGTNDAVMEGADIEAFLDCPVKGEAIEDSQIYCLDKIVEASPIVQVCSGDEGESSQHPCQFQTVERTHALVDNSASRLLDGDALVKNSCGHASVVNDEDLNIIEGIEQFGEDPKGSNLCVGVDQGSEDNHHLSPQSINNPEKCQQECVLENVITNASGSDFEICPNLGKMDNQLAGEDAHSASVGLELSADHHEHYNDRQFSQDMDNSVPAISSEFEYALKMTSTECGLFSEELAVKGVWTSPRYSQVGTGKRTFSSEIETKTAQDGNSPLGTLHNELDNAKASKKDKDATASVNIFENATIENWSKSVTATSTESCSFSEELAIKGVQTSPRRSSQVGIVDGPKLAFSDEIDTKIAQDGNGPVGKLHNEKDKDATALVKVPENVMNPNCCMRVPLLDALHHFMDNSDLFPQKINNSEECQQEGVLESVIDVPLKHSYVGGSDYESCFDLEKIDNRTYGADAPSGSAGIESSADHHEHFINRQLMQDMEHSGQDISLESNSALKMSKGWREGVTSTCPESCSFSEEYVTKGAQTSSRSNQIGMEDGSERIFLDAIAQDDSPVGKLQNELDNAKDMDVISSVNKYENVSKHTNCRIIPPWDAVHHFEDNHHLLPQNIDNSEQWQQENILVSVADVITKNSYSGGSDSESFHLEKMDDQIYGGGVPSGSIGIVFSTDRLEQLPDGQFSQDIEPGRQVFSLECDSASNMCKDWSKEATSTCLESCSFTPELVVKRVQVSRSSREDIQERSKRTYSNEIENESTQYGNSPSGKMHNDFDNVKDSAKDKDSTASAKQSENGIKNDKCIIIPPPNAVPFSDEWLTAMEAAGEDILTMKSGAVQNSPPHKSLPEPSPWSPVKRKNNEIGPFDCTKCTSVQPADL